jgi:hypothetical protein
VRGMIVPGHMLANESITITACCYTSVTGEGRVVKSTDDIVCRLEGDETTCKVASGFPVPGLGFSTAGLGLLPLRGQAQRRRCCMRAPPHTRAS